MPLWDRTTEQKNAQDPTTGCFGCASGKGAGPRNIFGNKYGQYLAAVQIAREERIAKQQAQRAAEEAARKQAGSDDEETDDDSDDDDEEDDYGPSPAAGIWAGSQKLQAESEKLAIGGDDDDAGDEETDDEDDEGPPLPPAKRQKQDD